MSVEVAEIKVTYINQDDELLTIEKKDEGAGDYYNITTSQDGFNLHSIDDFIKLFEGFKKIKI